MTKPGINSSEEELLNFVHEWVKLCAEKKEVEAFDLLDTPVEKGKCKWTIEDFEGVRFNHFDDNKLPEISDPDNFKDEIRNDIFKYDDGSGWGVEYDLPLNGIVSDFTLLFDFIKSGKELKVILDDCHVM